MISGTITTNPTSGSARRKRRGKAGLLAALFVVAAILTLRSIVFTGWFQEWRLGRMSLDALQHERGDRLDDPRLLFHIGVRLNEQAKFIEADPFLRNAVGLDPEDPRLRDAWAESLLHSGRITAAFGELSQYAGTHPSSASAHWMLGKFYASQESMTRACEELNKSVALDPSLSEAWTALAAAQSANGDLPKAVTAAEHASALRPKDGAAHLGLALLLQANGQADRARKEFIEAVAIAPKSAAAHREYARCLLTGDLQAPDPARAESEARRALQIDPNDVTASMILGKALLADDKPADAVPFLLRTAEVSPFDHPSALALLQAYKRLKQPDLVAKWERFTTERYNHAQQKLQLVTAIISGADLPKTHKRLARLLAEEGDVTGCIRHAAEALHCAPDAPPALIEAANQLNETGHAKEALPIVQRAIDEAANNPMARETLGNTLLALGHPEDAAKAYAKASRGFPDRIKMYQQKLDDEFARRHSGSLPHAPTTP